jgi:hypothetical protein
MIDHFDAWWLMAINDGNLVHNFRVCTLLGIPGEGNTVTFF